MTIAASLGKKRRPSKTKLGTLSTVRFCDAPDAPEISPLLTPRQRLKPRPVCPLPASGSAAQLNSGSTGRWEHQAFGIWGLEGEEKDREPRNRQLS